MAPAHPHATLVAMYPALLSIMVRFKMFTTMKQTKNYNNNNTHNIYNNEKNNSINNKSNGDAMTGLTPGEEQPTLTTFFHTAMADITDKRISFPHESQLPQSYIYSMGHVA